MYYSKCPICGSKTVVRTWHEDYYTVEIDEECSKCGYHKNWSYGMTEISFKGINEKFTYSTILNEYNNIYKRLNKARWSYRKYLLRSGLIKGKSYSKYF